jgi:predicted nucleic acid-binding protein
MILADTSTWVDHFRGRSTALGRLLTDAQVVMHPWVLGELTCGSLEPRARVLADLRKLPRLRVVDDREVAELIEQRQLHTSGLGWVDAHLLAASLVNNAKLLTFDRRLAAKASELGVAY